MLKHVLRKKWLLFVYFGGWVVYFAWFWSHAVFVDSLGNLVAGHVNIWGDWAAHFTMANALRVRGLEIASPFLLGAQFSYPFGADLISAGLMNLGWPLITAFVIPSYCFSLLMVVGLYFFYRAIFRSRRVAVLASLIFLLNGGVGFGYFINDVIHSPQPFFTLLNPPHEYTRLDTEHLKWISVIDSMMIPQRAFTLGFPVALIALTLIWTTLFQPLKKKQNFVLTRRHVFTLSGAGILLGLLPILHTHSFLACFIILVCWSSGQLWWAWRHHHFKQILVSWVIVALTTSIIALPILKTFFIGHVGQAFFKFYPGWLALSYQENWVIFWLKNWGITPIIALIGGGLWIKDQLRFSWAFPFFFLFILANLFLFQPFPWDNTKILVWSAVGVAGLAGYLIYFLWQKAQARFAILAIVLFLIMTASGGIDAYWISRTDLHSYQMYSASDLKLANWVMTSTPSDSIWLTGTYHNHWLFNLTGRQALMTYPGWLWTHGYAYRPTERDLQVMFRGEAEAKELLKKYGIAYVVIGPIERREQQANEGFFATNFPVWQSDQDTTIYKVE